MKKKLFKLGPIIFCLVFAAYLIISPSHASKAVLRALSLCALRLIPSLFPFFVLSSIVRGIGLSRTLSRTLTKPFSFLFGVSGCGALPLVLGFLGGYPVGVKTVCDMALSGEISKKEAERLLLFCGNTGPAFIIGAAGAGLFGSVRLGLVLYLTHILSAVTLGLLTRVIFGKIETDFKKAQNTNVSNFAQIFTYSVSESTNACLSITGFVTLFSLLSGLLDFCGVTGTLCALASRIGLDPVRSRAVLTGILELGSGIDALSAHAQNLSFALPACAFLLAWGGISVHCQAYSFISVSRLKCAPYVLSKLIQGVLAAIFTYLFIRFGGKTDVFSFWGHVTVKDFLFDYLGLFFSVSCALASLFLNLIRRIIRK